MVDSVSAFSTDPDPPVLPGAGSWSELPGAARCVGGVGVAGTRLITQQVVFGPLLVAGAVVGPAHSAVQLLAVGQQRSQAQQRRRRYRWVSVLLLSSLSFLSILILFLLHVHVTNCSFSTCCFSRAGQNTTTSSNTSSCTPAQAIITREVRGSDGAGGGSGVWKEASFFQSQLHHLLWIDWVFILKGGRETNVKNKKESRDSENLPVGPRLSGPGCLPSYQWKLVKYAENVIYASMFLGLLHMHYLAVNGASAAVQPGVVWGGNMLCANVFSQLLPNVSFT